MKFKPAVIASLFAALAATAAQADPYHHHQGFRPPAPGYGPPPVHVRPAPVYVTPAPVHVRPAPIVRYAPAPVYRMPPRDFRPVRERVVHYRGHIRPGPLPPPHVRIVRGHPMYWGEPLAVHEVRYLPAYDGYAWRRAGRDLALVALTTGLVYEVFYNVL